MHKILLKRTKNALGFINEISLLKDRQHHNVILPHIKFTSHLLTNTDVPHYTCSKLLGNVPNSSLCRISSLTSLDPNSPHDLRASLHRTTPQTKILTSNILNHHFTNQPRILKKQLQFFLNRGAIRHIMIMFIFLFPPRCRRPHEWL